MIFLRFFPVSFVLVVFFGFVISVYANGIGGTPVNPLHKSAPTWFVYTLSEGEEYTDHIEVINTLNTPALIKLIAVDGLSHSSSEDFLLKNKNDEMTEMGTWVTFDEEYVLVPAHSSVYTSFTVHIPQDYSLSSRRTTGGILFENVSYSMSNAYNKSLGHSLSLQTQQAVRIYNTIPR